MPREEVHILLVEDSAADVRLTQEVLRETGLRHRLRVARDGEQALRMLRREGEYVDSPEPELVLLDLNLPGKDGREVLREIKQDARLRRTPVLVVSTSTADNDIIGCYDAHANCYIAKPVGLGEFFELARALRTFWLDLACLPSRHRASQPAIPTVE
ncbi:MAG: response regulator [Sinobacteraceae bacterium]|nr:response regulator [Nevskiaceae bacterium]